MVMSDSSIYAALDLGTNNCRLLIAQAGKVDSSGAVSGPLQVLDSFSRIVRLGEGVSANGVLAEDAMARTLSALAACQKKLARHPVNKSRFVATEACRRASNGQDFMGRIYAETGLEVEIISTEEEARLAFLGCASLITQTARQAIVFDIGGGSTELMWIDVNRAHAGADDAGGITDWLSINCGVMNLADKFGGQGFADLAFRDMVDYMEHRIVPFDEKNQITESIGDSHVQLLSTSGTVTTLAAIHLGLPRYDRSKIDGIKLRVRDIRETTRKLLAMRPSERFNHPCIGPDRADYIMSGCAIFEAISNVWPTGEITIADRGVREGIILSLMGD